MKTSWYGNGFRITGPLWGESTDHGWFSHQRPVVRGFDIFYDVDLNMLFNKQPNYLRFKTSWYQCDISVMQNSWIIGRLLDNVMEFFLAGSLNQLLQIPFPWCSVIRHLHADKPVSRAAGWWFPPCNQPYDCAIYRHILYSCSPFY